MIVRTWRCRAPFDRPDDYVAHFNSKVLPELHAVDGFVSAMLLRRNRKHDIEFLVVTIWASIEAIHGFAGAAYDRAVVEPGAVAALASFDEAAEHYEVVNAAVAGMPGSPD